MLKFSITMVALVATMTVYFQPTASYAGDESKEIAKLRAQVKALQMTVSGLQAQLTALQNNKALLLGPFVTVNPNSENGLAGPNLR